MTVVEISSSDRKTTMMESALSFAGRMGGFVMRYGAYFLIARILGLKNSGFYFLVLSAIRIFCAVSVLGLDQGMIRYISIHKSTGDRTRAAGTIIAGTLPSLAVSIVISIVVYIYAPWISTAVFKKPEIAILLKTMIAGLPLLTLLTIFVSVIQGYGKMRIRALCEDIIWPIANFGGIYALKFIGHNTMSGVVFIYVSSIGLTALLSGLMMLKTGKDTLDWSNPVVEWKTVFTYSAPLILRSLFVQVLMWTDVMMVGMFRPAEDVGIYFMASRLIVMVSSTNAILGSVASPMFSSLSHAGEKSRLGILYEFNNRLTVALQLPIIAIMWLCGSQALNIFGKEYTAGTGVLDVLLIAQVIVTIGGASAVMLVMTGHSGTSLANSGLGAAANIVLNIILIPRMGILGAALSTAIVKSTLSVIRIFQVQHFTGLMPFSSKYIPPLIAIFISTAVTAAARAFVPALSSTFHGLIASGILFSILMIAGLRLTIPPEEIKDMADIFRKRENGKKLIV